MQSNESKRAFASLSDETSLNPFIIAENSLLVKGFEDDCKNFSTINSIDIPILIKYTEIH